MYELLRWFLGHLGKFPRSHRYGLGQQIKQRLYAVFHGLLRAKRGAAADDGEVVFGVGVVGAEAEAIADRAAEAYSGRGGLVLFHIK